LINENLSLHHLVAQTGVEQFGIIAMRSSVQAILILAVR
jgi:hypothetical protein